MRPSPRRYRAASLICAAALALSACGGGDDGGDGSKAEPLPQTAVDRDSSLPGDTTIPDREGTSLSNLQGDPNASLAPAPGAGDDSRGTENFFGPDSPWNTRIDAAEVDENSNQMIRLSTRRLESVEESGSFDEGTTSGLRSREVVREDGVYINTDAWTTPVVSGGESTPVICRQAVCGDGDDTLNLEVPTDIDPDPRYDGWFTIIDSSKNVAYDLWRARRESNGSITYHFMRTWELDGPGHDITDPPTLVSARGSGLPLFAGLIQPGELASGQINHALAISIPAPAQGSYVAPASSTDGNGYKRSIPEGARLRLKDVQIPAPVDPVTGKEIPLTAAQRRQSDAIRAALRTYGAIVVDRAAVPTLYAQRDVLVDQIDGNELQGLRMEDFEVIDLGEKYPYPPDSDVEAGASEEGAGAPETINPADPSEPDNSLPDTGQAQPSARRALTGDIR